MDQLHRYQTHLVWTGNNGSGTDGYRNYERSYRLWVDNKAVIEGSSDPMFRGDREKYNPEDLLVAALSSCHMLSFLHVCVDAGVIVTEYFDDAEGFMHFDKKGGGRFTEVILRPRVTVLRDEMVDRIHELHQKASQNCFIANSVNFPVRHEPETRVAQ